MKFILTEIYCSIRKQSDHCVTWEPCINFKKYIDLEDGTIPEQEKVFVCWKGDLVLTTKSNNFSLKT